MCRQRVATIAKAHSLPASVAPFIDQISNSFECCASWQVSSSPHRLLRRLHSSSPAAASSVLRLLTPRTPLRLLLLLPPRPWLV